jgi:trehalose-6-phosphate synthase
MWKCQKNHYKIHKKTCSASKSSSSESVGVNVGVNVSASVNLSTPSKESSHNHATPTATTKESKGRYYIKNLKESLLTTLENFVETRNHHYNEKKKGKCWFGISAKTRSVNFNNPADIRKWVGVDDDINEEEYEKREEGMTAIYHNAIHEVFTFVW